MSALGGRAAVLEGDSVAATGEAGNVTCAVAERAMPNARQADRVTPSRQGLIM
jgi:hypothetical protein